MIINLSLPRRRETSKYKRFWIPAFAGMTFLEVALSLQDVLIELKKEALQGFVWINSSLPSGGETNIESPALKLARIIINPFPLRRK